MARVFISHASADAEPAALLDSILRVNGYEPWVFSSQLHAGDEWKHEIDHAISSSIALILIVTKSSLCSSFVTYEWAFALGLGIRVIPLLLEEDAELHPKLADLQLLEFRKAKERDWKDLLFLLSSISNKDVTFIRSLEAEINSADPDRRAVAFSRLAAIKTEEATEALHRLTNHALAAVWKAAARELGKRKVVGASGPLIRLLELEAHWGDMSLLVDVDAEAAVGHLPLFYTRGITVDSIIEFMEKAMGTARNSVLTLMRTWSTCTDSVLKGRVSIHMLDRYDGENRHAFCSFLLGRSESEVVRSDALKVIKREWAHFDANQKELVFQAMVVAIREQPETTAPLVAEIFCNLEISNTTRHIEEWKRKMFMLEGWDTRSNIREFDATGYSSRGFYCSRGFYYWRAIGILTRMGSLEACRELRKLILRMMFPGWRMILFPFVRTKEESLRHFARQVARGRFGQGFPGFDWFLFTREIEMV
jgi:hypothetical protein